jgi:hypothetical protein
MRAEAEIVRSTMRWAHNLVDNWTRPSGRTYSTGYTRCTMNGMMTRADAATALAIALDLDCVRDVHAEARQVAAQQLEDEDRETRTAPIGLECAEELVRQARVSIKGDRRALFEQGCRMTYWADVARHWPGRVPHSLRDDWEGIALEFWRGNQDLFERTAEIFFFTSGKKSDILGTMHASASPRNLQSSGSF